MAFWLRACPKCGGDLEFIPDPNGAYVECVQCGLELNPVQERLLRRLGRIPHDQPDAAAQAASRPSHHEVA